MPNPQGQVYKEEIYTVRLSPGQICVCVMCPYAPRYGRDVLDFAHALNFHPVGCPMAAQTQKCSTCNGLRARIASDHTSKY